MHEVRSGSCTACCSCLRSAPQGALAAVGGVGPAAGVLGWRLHAARRCAAAETPFPLVLRGGDDETPWVSLV